MPNGNDDYRRPSGSAALREDPESVRLRRENVSLRDVLAGIAPHILVDGTHCYCSIWGGGFNYHRPHRQECIEARAALGESA